MSCLGIAMNRSVFLANFLLCSALMAQSGVPTSAGAPSPAAKSGAANTAKTAPFRNQSTGLERHARLYYESVWGVDALDVKWTESGEIIRFTYRVVDPEKARQLNDKQNQPSLVDPEAHVSLAVPTMEKVDMLRQTSNNLEAGKSYWMAFSNKGRPVKRGHRVDVVIGQFRAKGLIVD